VVLDASVLLGPRRTFLVAGAYLHYYDAFWSSWIIGEFVRKRTEWIADRAVREGCDRAELRRRLQASRDRINAAIAEMAHVLRSVDYTRAPAVDLSWLADPDDHPIIQTALVARAHVLVTDDGDFPHGERRNGIYLVRSEAFIVALSQSVPEMPASIRAYLRSP
jgi:predicted nucleic acid-binding protein